MLFTWVPLAIVCAYLFYNRFLHPLRHIPGPFFASLSPLWIVYQSYHRRRPRLDIKLHEKYGSVVRISPDEIIFSNADYFRTVYGAGTKFKKGRFYEAPTDRSQPNNWEKLDMLTEQDTEKLRVQKRFSGPMYSENNARRHEHYLDNNLNRMLTRFATLTGKSLDLYTEFEYFIEDSMTEFTFGSPYGAVEAGTDGGHMASMDKMWAWWGWIGQMPWLNEIDKRFAPWAIIFSDVVSKSINLPIFPYVVGQIMAYDKAVAEKKDAPSCLLSDFRQLTKERPEFREGWGTHLSVTNLGAGVDTMSWTMAAFVVGIGQNPSVAAKLHTEIGAAIASGEISKAKPVSYDVAAKLPYFQACIQECMRMWPNIAMSLPRIVPDEGMTIDGYEIPGGSTVGMNSKVLGLNEKVFGDRPKEFRPERWLEADKQSKDSMVTRNLAFGGPSRKCPGMHLAMFTISKALATLYANFDVDILNELDGKPGPGGHIWREYGSFPTKFLVALHNWYNGVNKVKDSLKKDENALRIGVISAAAINVSAIIDPTQTHPGATITAIAAREKSRAQAQIDYYKLGADCKAYGSYAALLNDREIDAVYIPLPNGLHTEWAIKAMEAGKHVLIEKPISSNAAEARKITETALKTNKVAVEAFHWRFQPAAHAVREIIESGKYGAPTSIFAQLVAPAGAIPKDDIRVKYDLAGGSSMDFIYVLSATTYFASSDFTKCGVEVSRAKATLNPRDNKVDDAMEAEFIVRPPGKPPVICRTEANFEAPPILGFIPRISLPYVTVELEKAKIHFHNFVLPTYGHSITITEKDASGEFAGTKTKQKVYKDGPQWGKRGEEWWTTYRWQLEAFVDMIRAKESGKEYSGPWMTLEESEKLMGLVDSVYDKAGLPRRGMEV